jgi:hypothetical protein
MENLNKLIQKCKCGVHLSVNKHRDYHETVEQYFIKNKYLEDVDKDVFEKMKELNTIIELHYYPDTPIGFYNIFHYDLQMAIDEALHSLNIT